MELVLKHFCTYNERFEGAGANTLTKQKLYPQAYHPSDKSKVEFSTLFFPESVPSGILSLANTTTVLKKIYIYHVSLSSEC